MAYGAILGQKPPLPSIENIYQIGDIVPSLNSDMGPNFVPCDGRHINAADGTNVLKGKLEPRVVVAYSDLFSNNTTIFKWENELYLIVGKTELINAQQVETFKSYKSSDGTLTGEFKFIGDVNKNIKNLSNKSLIFNYKSFTNVDGIFKQGEYYYVPAVLYYEQYEILYYSSAVLKTKDFINFEQDFVVDENYSSKEVDYLSLYKHPNYNKVILVTRIYKYLRIRQGIFSNGKTNLSNNKIENSELEQSFKHYALHFSLDKNSNPMLFIFVGQATRYCFYKIELNNSISTNIRPVFPNLHSVFNPEFLIFDSGNNSLIVISASTETYSIVEISEIDISTDKYNTIEPNFQIKVGGGIPSNLNNKFFLFFTQDNNSCILTSVSYEGKIKNANALNDFLTIKHIRPFENKMMDILNDRILFVFGEGNDGRAFVSDEYLPDLNSDSNSVKYFIKIK